MQKRAWLIILISIAIAIGLNNILFVTNLAAYSPGYQEAAEKLYAPSFGMQIVYTVLLAPIIEEFVFRGLIFKVLRKWIPFVFAMSISAVLFGLYHGNLVQFVYAGICGLLFAYLCEKFKTILAPMFSHMIMNLVAVTMTQWKGFQWIFENPFRVVLSTILCIIVIGKTFIKIQKMDVT